MDNQSAICVVKIPEHQECLRHLNPIHYGFREEVEAGEISPHCPNCGYTCGHPDQGINLRAGWEGYKYAGSLIVRIGLIKGGDMEG